MKARDFDTMMSVLGAVTTVGMIVLKGLHKLDIETQDCLLAGSIVALCTKFIAVARIVGVWKEVPSGDIQEKKEK
jgi:hypothetical protein